jgi:ABC-type Fe3+-citrate transport system substrate-binding protein
MKKNIVKVLSVLFAGLFLVTACSKKADTETKTEEKAEKGDAKDKKTGEEEKKNKEEATK